MLESSAYDLLTRLSICGNKRTKALKLLAEIAENSSRCIWSRRNERSLHKDQKNSRETPGSHDLGVARSPKSVRSQRKHLLRGGFFSEDSRLLIWLPGEFLQTEHGEHALVRCREVFFLLPSQKPERLVRESKVIQIAHYSNNDGLPHSSILHCR